MHLYFAGHSTQNLSKVPGATHLLESYLYFKKKDFVQWNRERGTLDRKHFIDSGAFSAFTRGEKIDIDDYIAFIKRYEQYLEVYATLDVIGDYEATRRNTEYMRAQNLTPLPTFHYNSPLSELERLVGEGNYIALGGLVPLAMKQKVLQNWLDCCFSIIKTKVKVHGFGVNSYWAWERYPFFSVDATSWLMGGKFRRMVKFNGKGFDAISKFDTSLTNVARMKAIAGEYQDLNLQNATEYLKARDQVTKLWAKRGVIWND